MSGFTNEEANNRLIPVLEDLEAKMQKLMDEAEDKTNFWYSGIKTPMMLDIVTFTCAERICIMDGTLGQKGYDLVKLPACTQYVKNFRSHPLFKDHVLTLKSYNKHLKVEMESAAKTGKKYGLTLDILE